MGQVVRHFDGLMAPIGCVSVTCNQHCTQAYRCRFRRILLEIRNMTARHMDNMTLAQIVAGRAGGRSRSFRFGIGSRRRDLKVL